jgi:NAD(P)-dependent dehydrogenase (short-subunit alcohol dehydrogenase family)
VPSGLIIVTGGSRGIGAAICRRLAADGYAIAVNYAADAKAGEATAAAIVKSGGRAQAFKADVADPAALHGMFEQATQALGPLMGLVNNAGSSGRFARTDEQDAAELTRLFATNVIATILPARRRSSDFRPATAGRVARSSTSRRLRRGPAGCRDS